MKDFTYEEIAGMIDHSLLHPTLSEKELFTGCALAEAYVTATVCVKPYHVSRAVKLLQSSKVEVCTVIGFPHGGNLTEIKALETKRACEEGASEVDMVINIGKTMDADWKYVEEDIRAVSQVAHAHNAKTKVIFENDYLNLGSTGLNHIEFKQMLCKICENLEVAWVKTSTGFAYIRQKDGTMKTQGAMQADVSLMSKTCGQGTQVKAAGGVQDLSTLLQMKSVGATRVGTSSTQKILDECRVILGLAPISIIDSSTQTDY